MAPLSGGALPGSGSSGAAIKAPPPLLPFGPTLHYTGCGCPYTWAAGCRLCDWGDSWVQQAHSSMAPQRGQAHLAPIRKLKVGFCIPHANVTGGLKMLLEQMRLLGQRGHYVVALTRSELADTAVPAWSDVQVDEDVVVRLNQRFRDCYDVDSCDVIVTGIFHQVPEWLNSTSAPVLYYEQGHEWLFGDPVRFHEGAGNYKVQDQLFHMAMHLPVALAAVSEAVQSIICHEFGRSCLLVHNGVDCQRFHPGAREAAVLDAPTRVLGPPAHGQATPPANGAVGRLPSVLLVGNPALSLKGFDCAIATLALVQRSKPVEVHWVCQQEPPEQLAALIQSSRLRINLHVNPPQDRIPAYYRGHDCFLFTSKYEAWGMPVLEAMASGLPIVATETAGVSSFATASVDCLMAPAGDASELAQHVLNLLEDAPLAARLSAAARQTALGYTPAKVVAQLERALYSLTACRQELLALRLQALPDTQMAAAAAVKACAGAASAHKAAVKARQQRDAAAAAAAALAQAEAALGPQAQGPVHQARCNHCNLLRPLEGSVAAAAAAAAEGQAAGERQHGAAQQQEQQGGEQDCCRCMQHQHPGLHQQAGGAHEQPPQQQEQTCRASHEEEQQQLYLQQQLLHQQQAGSARGSYDDQQQAQQVGRGSQEELLLLQQAGSARGSHEQQLHQHHHQPQPYPLQHEQQAGRGSHEQQQHHHHHHHHQPQPYPPQQEEQVGRGSHEQQHHHHHDHHHHHHHHYPLQQEEQGARASDEQQLQQAHHPCYPQPQTEGEPHQQHQHHHHHRPYLHHHHQQLEGQASGSFEQQQEQQQDMHPHLHPLPSPLPSPQLSLPPLPPHQQQQQAQQRGRARGSYELELSHSSSSSSEGGAPWQPPHRCFSAPNLSSTEAAAPPDSWS